MKKLILLLAAAALIPAVGFAQKSSGAAKLQLHCVLAEFMQNPVLSDAEWLRYARTPQEAQFMRAAFIFAVTDYASEREQKLSEMQSLLSADAALINAADLCGNTALHYAAAVDNSDLAHFLFLYGINGRVYNVEGRTPLHVARKGSFRQMAKELVSYDPELSHMMYTPRK